MQKVKNCVFVVNLYQPIFYSKACSCCLLLLVFYDTSVSISGMVIRNILRFLCLRVIQQTDRDANEVNTTTNNLRC